VAPNPIQFKKPDLIDFMWPYPRLLAHRGAGTLAPENTLAALRFGWERGYRATEFDVMLSGDDVPVLMHDPQFGRTIAGKGRVADFTAGELQRMDAGSWYGPDFAGEPVPLYEEAYRFCRAHGIWMNVEIKPSPGAEARTGRVVAQLTQQLIEAHGALSPQPAVPLFSSFSMEALLEAKAAAPAIPRALLVKSVPVGWQKQLRKLEAVALHVQQSRLTAAQAQEIKAAGYGLFCYIVNDPARAEVLLSWGVDAFCTDRLDLFDPASPAFRR
jgi:glycerophosphoryl diester phosphodiesterase